MKAKTPIFHGGDEKTGVVILLHRMKFLTEDGIEEIPIISGNAIRGVLRRIAMKDFFDQIGYEIDVESKKGIYLYHAFFSGGILETVEEKESGVIDIAMKKRIFSLLPPVRLFGFSYKNQMVTGKLKVGHALPVCRELRDFLPSDVKSEISYYDMIGKCFQTRKDELRIEREENEQAVQKLIEYEVFNPGTIFYHEFKIEDPEEIDLSCFARVLNLWKERPYVGGKSSIGLGELQINYDFDGEEGRYLHFLKEKRKEIIDLLESL